MGAPLDLAPYLWPDAAAGRLPASRSSAALRDDGPTAGWIGWDAKTDLFGAPVSIGTSGDAHCYTGPAGDFIQTASGTNRVVQFGGSFAVPADKSILVVARCDTIPSGLDAVVALTGNVADPEGGGINQWGGQIGVSSAGNVRIGDYDGSVRFATAGGGAVSAGQWFCAAGAVRSGVGLIAAKDGVLGTQVAIGTAQSNAAWSLLCNVKDQYNFMAEQFAGAVAMVLWWPRALSNDELVAYTANPALALPAPHVYIPMGGAGGNDLAASGGSATTGAAQPAVSFSLASVGVVATGGGAASAVALNPAAVGLATTTGAAQPSAAITLTAAGLVQSAGLAGVRPDVLVAAAGAALTSGNATLALLALEAAAGSASSSGNATVAALINEAAAGTVTTAGIAALQAAIAAQASGGSNTTGGATLAGGPSGTLNASGGSASGGTAGLDITATLLASGGSASGGNIGPLSLTVTVTAAGIVQAVGAGFLVISAPLSAFGQVTTGGTAGLVDLGVVVLIPNDRYLIDARGRSWEVEASGRSWEVGL